MIRTDDPAALAAVTDKSEEFEFVIGDTMVTVEPHNHKMEPTAVVFNDSVQLTCTECPYSSLVPVDINDYVRTDCGCGIEVVYTPEGWQHDAAPYFWGDDHDAIPSDPDFDLKAEAWQFAWDEDRNAS